MADEFRRRFVYANIVLENDQVSRALVDVQADLLDEGIDPDRPHDDQDSAVERLAELSSNERNVQEVVNGLRQYDLAIEIAREAKQSGTLDLNVPLILALHRAATSRLSPEAGNFRRGGVRITGQRQPPAALIVPELVHDLCEYVNRHWVDASRSHLMAYALWRLEWIRPFKQGTGPVARVLSFLIGGIKTGMTLDGRAAVPERIQVDYSGYQTAIDSASTAWDSGDLNLAALEHFLEGSR
jgi:hypothetical protein